MKIKIVNIVAVLVFAVLGMVILGSSMAKPVARDEQMYCTAGYFISQGKTIYRDFSYIAQMPYHPLIYAGIYKLTGTNYFLFTGRLLSVFCDITTVACILLIYRKIFGQYKVSGTLLGLFAAIFFVFNFNARYMMGYAWNHDLILMCVALSFLIYISMDTKNDRNIFPRAAIGALLTIAACTRVTTGLVYLVFFIMLFISTVGSFRKKLLNCWPFLAASAVFLVWPIYLIAQSYKAFLVDIFTIPHLNSELLHQMNMVYDKFQLTIFSLTTPGYFLLMISAVIFSLYAFLLRRKLVITDGRNAALSLLLTASFFLIAYIPPTMWIQYLGPPVFFIIVSIAYPLRYLISVKNSVPVSFHFRICSAVFVAFAITGALVESMTMDSSLDISRWVPLDVHRKSVQAAANIDGQKLILTLSPLYAIEGGAKIYPEFSAGAFAYRVADELSETQRKITHTAGPASLAVLLKNSPPDAVIIGSESANSETAPIKELIDVGWDKTAYSDFDLYLKR